MPPVRLTFLGTGTSQGVPVVGCPCPVCLSTNPHDQRLRTSALLQVEGKQLLIDAGPDLRQQLLRAEVNHIDAVLLTHEHMDHIGGIDDLRALNYRMKRPMDLHASQQTLDALKSMYAYAFAEDRYPGVPDLRLHPIADRVFEAADVAIEAVEVMHYRVPVLGFRIGGLAYITDAKTIADEEVERLRGVHTLVLNALRIEEHISHFNLKEALAMVERIAPQRAYFTHISHLLGKHTEVSEKLPAGVELSYDGLVIEVPE